jgi:hypothetical protein
MTAAEVRFDPIKQLDAYSHPYVLRSLLPEILPGGVLVFTFTAFSHGAERPTVEIPGLFKLDSNVLHVNEDKAVSLPLVHADESSSGRKFKISIVHTAKVISIVASPLTAGSGYTDQIEAAFSQMSTTRGRAQAF